MVSYYNYTQKHSAANLAYSTGQPWNWTPNYPTGNHQFLSDMDTSPHPHPQMYYNPHMFHSPANVTNDWHSPTSTVGAENFAQSVPTSAHHLIHAHHAHNLGVGLPGSLAGGAGGIGGGGGSGVGSNSSASNSSSSNGPAVNTQLNETNNSLSEQQQQQQQQQHIAEGLPSPPITVSGSEISSPGAPASSSSPHHIAHHLNNSGSSAGGGGNNSSHHSNNNNNNNSPSTNNNNTSAHNNNNHRASPAKQHQYYDWMKKPAYPAQPQPGKTRTKDKYRVVYTDYQRLELEKEYCTSRYITIRRKSELAQSLSLSERQVKIWFQNRRAKERKQNKKGSDPTVMSAVQHNDYMLDAKTKFEPGLHLHNALHPMNHMTGMPMRLQHLTHSHSLAAAAAVHTHQLQHSMSAAAAAAGVGTLTM